MQMKCLGQETNTTRVSGNPTDRKIFLPKSPTQNFLFVPTSGEKNIYIKNNNLIKTIISAFERLPHSKDKSDGMRIGSVTVLKEI